MESTPKKKLKQNKNAQEKVNETPICIIHLLLLIELRNNNKSCLEHIDWWGQMHFEFGNIFTFASFPWIVDELMTSLSGQYFFMYIYSFNEATASCCHICIEILLTLKIFDSTVFTTSANKKSRLIAKNFANVTSWYQMPILYAWMSFFWVLDFQFTISISIFFYFSEFLRDSQ